MAERNCCKISVIVPVYGVERFVGRCVESLMNQTLQDAEFIFVDDCTPDASIEIVSDVISRYPHRIARCKILAHDVNLGLPAARNTGMAEAAGQYVLQCDSDDYLEPEMLEKLYGKAVEADADIVWSDWYLSFEGSERYMSQPDAATGRSALGHILAGSMKYNVWNKLVRRTLFTDNNIQFPSWRAMGEDMTMIRLMACAGRTAHVAEALYHYVRTNAGAITQTYSARRLEELRLNVDETESFLRMHVHDDSINRELNLFKLSVKLPFLFTGHSKDCSIWRKWYPEANRHIMGNKKQALHTRMLQWCAAKGLTWVNIVYTRLVFNFFYGTIFK